MTGRPSAAARGYGHQHKQLRKAWARKVATGGVTCARCDQPIRPGERWDLGHIDGNQILYSGPEHARCNRATNSHRVVATDPKPTPRTQW